MTGSRKSGYEEIGEVIEDFIPPQEITGNFSSSSSSTSASSTQPNLSQFQHTIWYSTALRSTNDLSLTTLSTLTSVWMGLVSALPHDSRIKIKLFRRLGIFINTILEPQHVNPMIDALIHCTRAVDALYSKDKFALPQYDFIQQHDTENIDFSSTQSIAKNIFAFLNKNSDSSRTLFFQCLCLYFALPNNVGNGEPNPFSNKPTHFCIQLKESVEKVFLTSIKSLRNTIVRLQSFSPSTPFNPDALLPFFDAFEDEFSLFYLLRQAQLSIGETQYNYFSRIFSCKLSSFTLFTTSPLTSEEYYCDESAPITASIKIHNDLRSPLHPTYKHYAKFLFNEIYSEDERKKLQNNWDTITKNTFKFVQSYPILEQLFLIHLSEDKNNFGVLCCLHVFLKNYHTEKKKHQPETSSLKIQNDYLTVHAACICLLIANEKSTKTTHLQSEFKKNMELVFPNSIHFLIHFLHSILTLQYDRTLITLILETQFKKILEDEIAQMMQHQKMEFKIHPSEHTFLALFDKDIKTLEPEKEKTTCRV